MNDSALKQKILKYLSSHRTSVSSLLMIVDLDMTLYTLRALCDELKEEGYVLIGAESKRDCEVMISDKGRRLLDKGGYKKLKIKWYKSISTWAKIAGIIAVILAIVKALTGL